VVATVDSTGHNEITSNAICQRVWCSAAASPPLALTLLRRRAGQRTRHQRATTGQRHYGVAFWPFVIMTKNKKLSCRRGTARCYVEMSLSTRTNRKLTNCHFMLLSAFSRLSVWPWMTLKDCAYFYFVQSFSNALHAIIFKKYFSITLKGH